MPWTFREVGKPEREGHAAAPNVVAVMEAAAVPDDDEPIQALVVESAEESGLFSLKYQCFHPDGRYWNGIVMDAHYYGDFENAATALEHARRAFLNE